MQHPDAHVRFYTARALGRLGDVRALPALAWAVAHDTLPITDTKSIGGKSVGRVAAQAIHQIQTAHAAAPAAGGAAGTSDPQEETDG